MTSRFCQIDPAEDDRDQELRGLIESVSPEAGHILDA
jgi:hypothetical protein